MKDPPYVLCYLCGRKYGTRSIAIHEPQCLKKWHAENQQLPRHLRRKPPQRPQGYDDLLSCSTGNYLDQVNADAFRASQDQLVPCMHCGRKFMPDRLPVHQRSCTADKPAKPVSKATIDVATKPTSSKLAQRHWHEEKNNRLYEAPLDQDFGDGETHHYLTTEFTKHRSRQWKARSEPSSSGVKPLPSMGLQGREDDDGMSRHQLLPTLPRSPNPKDRGRAPVSGKGPRHSTETMTGMTMAQCPCCGRSFTNDRIQKHHAICNKSKQRRTKVFDSSKKRVEGTEASKFFKPGKTEKRYYESKSNWRQTHQDFISAIRAAKQASNHIAKGGKASELPPPPPSLNPDYVYCQHCQRRFNPQVAERHIPKCKTTINRPAPPRERAIDSYYGSSQSKAVPARDTQPTLQTLRSTNHLQKADRKMEVARARKSDRERQPLQTVRGDSFSRSQFTTQQGSSKSRQMTSGYPGRIRSDTFSYQKSPSSQQIPPLKNLVSGHSSEGALNRGREHTMSYQSTENWQSYSKQPSKFRSELNSTPDSIPIKRSPYWLQKEAYPGPTRKGSTRFSYNAGVPKNFMR